MVKRLVASLVLCLSVVGLSPAVAQEDTVTVQYEAAGLEFVVPTDWDFKEEEGVLTVGPANAHLEITFYEAEAESVEAAVEELRGGTEAIAFDEVERTRAHELNGLRVTTFEATGTLREDGTEVKCAAAVLVSPNDQVIVLFIVSSSKAVDAYDDPLAAMFQSLRPSE